MTDNEWFAIVARVKTALKDLEERYDYDTVHLDGQVVEKTRS